MTVQRLFSASVLIIALGAPSAAFADPIPAGDCPEGDVPEGYSWDADGVFCNGDEFDDDPAFDDAFCYLTGAGYTIFDCGLSSHGDLLPGHGWIVSNYNAVGYYVAWGTGSDGERFCCMQEGEGIQVVRLNGASGFDHEYFQYDEGSTNYNLSSLNGGGLTAYMTGEPGDDYLLGSRDNSGNLYERLDGGTGRDEVRGSLGNDWVCGGPDDDEVYGGSGNDIVVGEGGNDYVEADPVPSAWSNDQCGDTGDTQSGCDDGVTNLTVCPF